MNPTPLFTHSTPPCIYCQQLNSVPLFNTFDTQHHHYTLYQCNNCKAVFLTPFPTPQQLAAAYDDAYYGEQEDKFEGFIEKILNYFRAKRARLLTHQLPHQAKILDIGCGNGQMLGFVQQQGDFDIYGIEMPGKAARRAAQIPHIQLKEGTLQANDFAPNTFDAISLFHVFEHLTQPKQTLQIIQDILKPNGRLVVSIPNIDSWQAKIFKGKWLHLDPPRHLFFFSPKDLTLQLQKFGFELEQEKHFSIEYNPFGAQQSILNVLLKDREVLYEHLKGNKVYTKAYPKWHLALQRLFFQTTFPLFILTDAVAACFKKGATIEMVYRLR